MHASGSILKITAIGYIYVRTPVRTTYVHAYSIAGGDCGRIRM